MSDFMTATETAERLGVSVARVYQLAREARLPHVRRGRRLLIPTAAWELWLSQQVAIERYVSNATDGHVTGGGRSG